MPLNCWTRRRSWTFRCVNRSSRENVCTVSLSRWWSGLSGGTWKIVTSRSKWLRDWTSGARRRASETGSTVTFWYFWWVFFVKCSKSLIIFFGARWLTTFDRPFPFNTPLSFSTLPRLMIAWHLPFTGPCLIPVILLMPFSHVVDTWLNCDAPFCCWDEAGCDDDDDTVMEWCVVELLVEYCPSGAGCSWWDLKNFGEVRGDFDAPFMWPFRFAFTDDALMIIFCLGSLWCWKPLMAMFSSDSIDGSCCRNWRL